MSVESIIYRDSDHGIRVGGVTAREDPTIPLAVDTATVTGRIYDRSKVRKVTEDTDGAGGSPTIMHVNGVEAFDDGDPIELTLDDGTLHNTTIASRDEDADTITLTAGIPGTNKVFEGTFAKRKFGSNIAMVLYGGTPAPNSDTWGYVGPVSDTHEGLHKGQNVRCEVTIDDGVDRKRIVTFDAKVVDR